MIRFGWICLLFGFSVLTLHAQVSLQKADSLTLHFPGKPLEKDPYPPAVIFLDGYLMVFPGDFTAHFFQRQDTGYVYRSTIKFWTEKNGKIFWRQAFQFFVANGSLWGIGDQCLYRYSLTKPESPIKTINLFAPGGQYLVDCPYELVNVGPKEGDIYQLYLPTRTLSRSKTLIPSDKAKQKANAGAMFARFDLILDDMPKVIDRQGYGINRQTDLTAFVNFHYSWLREGNIVTDGRQIFHSTHADGKIRCFDFKGELVDSINAIGEMLPWQYLKSPDKLTRSAVTASIDASGYYDNLMTFSNKEYLVRQYGLPKGADGIRGKHLQLINKVSKKIYEMPIPLTIHYLRVDRDQLYHVSEWDFSKGFVKIQFFDIHVKENAH